MKVLVVGDVLVEVTCQVPYRFRDLTGDRLTHVPVEAALGGTAANFALAATDRFDEVILGGCVGQDVFGTFALGALEVAGVSCRVRRTPDVPTGLALYQRDGSSEIEKGVRHLVIATPSANDVFGPGDVDELEPVLGDVDLVVVDGYAMRHAPRREATLAAMARGRSFGADVVFDVVPHDCFRQSSLADLTSVVAAASVVIVEARTLLGFVGAPFPEIIDEPAVDEAVAVAGRLWPDKVVLLRFGIGNVNEVTALLPDAQPVRYRTGYARSRTPRGFGDRLAVEELARLASAGSRGLARSGVWGGVVESETEEGGGDVVLEGLGDAFEEEVG